MVLTPSITQLNRYTLSLALPSQWPIKVSFMYDLNQIWPWPSFLLGIRKACYWHLQSPNSIDIHTLSMSLPSPLKVSFMYDLDQIWPWPLIFVEFCWFSLTLLLIKCEFQITVSQLKCYHTKLLSSLNHCCSEKYVYFLRTNLNFAMIYKLFYN